MFNKAEHNRKIKLLRDLGKLPYQDGTYRPNIFIPTDEERWRNEANEDYKRVKVSPNGSILPNKYLYWS